MSSNVTLSDYYFSWRDSQNLNDIFWARNELATPESALFIWGMSFNFCKKFHFEERRGICFSALLWTFGIMYLFYINCCFKVSFWNVMDMFQKKLGQIPTLHLANDVASDLTCFPYLRRLLNQMISTDWLFNRWSILAMFRSC